MREKRALFMLALLMLVVVASGQAKPGVAQAKATTSSLTSCFVKNEGQWDPRVQFLYQGPGLNLFLTKEGGVFEVTKPKDAKTQKLAKGLQRDVVRMTFVDARSGQAEGLDELDGKFNYFIGRDKSKWRSNVPRYAEVRTQPIYKGVSVRYYLENGRPRYALIVQPGADPSRVAMRFDGAESVHTASDGSLQIKTSLGVIEERNLVAYQVVGTKRVTVACRMQSNGSVARFDTGHYDRAKALVIDPLIFATYFYVNIGYQKIALDGNNNIVIATSMQSGADFPTTTGVYQTAYNAELDAVVTKLDTTGHKLYFGTFIGAPRQGYSSQGDMVVAGLTVAPNGSYTVCGTTDSNGFPATAGAYQTTYVHSYQDATDDGFILQLNSAGSALNYATYLGDGSEFIEGMTIDSQGNIVVIGDGGKAAFASGGGTWVPSEDSVSN